MNEKRRVMMYTLSTCGYCKSAKTFMHANDVPFDYIDVDLLDTEEKRRVLREAREIAKLDRISFPLVVIGDIVIVGFMENEIRRTLGL